MTLLDIENLDFFMGSTQILRSVSFSVNEGEVVCLLGRNGSGRTSIIKNIIGLYLPRSGKIVFRGNEITRMPPRNRVLMGIAYSPEDSRLFSELTVEENIKIAAWVRGEKNDTFNFESVFEIFPEIKKLMKRKGLYLSGGERKMVSIARALALSPSLLLLDESFEGLAPVVINRFKEALKQIKDMGVTILLAESNIKVASLVSDRAYIVERGEVIFEGQPQEILQNEKLLRIIGGG
ncbi:MAG: ABC transporter ATP-binding protein [Deltaproteobacteria bacterium]|jgi:branched-chain amino acid transport system ATP-binding protein|nr:MAG: ABC transporter ATP-binding protein [Deltaproteobacteria bacterium]